jgi:hypothetical protein
MGSIEAWTSRVATPAEAGTSGFDPASLKGSRDGLSAREALIDGSTPRCVVIIAVVDGWIAVGFRATAPRCDRTGLWIGARRRPRGIGRLDVARKRWPERLAERGVM